MAICGVVKTNGIPETMALDVESMLSAMCNRDGEARSRYVDQGVSFGVISGLNSASIHSDPRLVVACDAEMHNVPELRKGISPSRQVTTIAGLIAELYLDHGEGFVNELAGAFAIAVWDKRTHALLLARDRLGIKPLCYAVLSSGFIFASQPRGVVASRLVGKRVNLNAIVDYLNFHVVPAPSSAYKNVIKMRPAEYLVWRQGYVHKAFYWQLRYTEEDHRTERKLRKELFSRLEDAVRVTAEDLDLKQVGCFLSGGTDSSSIAGFLSRIRQQPARAFSIGFAEERFDELSYALLAVRHFGLEHCRRIVGPKDAYELIPTIVDIFDEPFGNASAIPTYACVQLASDHGVKVILGGDGGDELFGGNERYRVHQIYDLYQRVPRCLRNLLEPALFAMPTEGAFIGKAKAYIQRSNTPNPERYCRWRLLQTYSSHEVLGDTMPPVNGDTLAAVRAHYQAAQAVSELNRLLYVDVNVTLGDEDLPKVVRTAEKVGIAVRFPYLQHSLAEFSGRLPAHLKVRGLEKRYLFKRAMRGFLPRQILKKKKHGFGLPVGVWLKTDPRLRSMARDVLLSPIAYQRGYYRRQFVEKLFSTLEQDDSPYFGDLLWVFLALELWHCRHAVGAAS